MALSLYITYSEFKVIAQTYSLQVYKEAVFTNTNIACFSGIGPNTIMYRVDGLMTADLVDFNSTFGGTVISVSTLDDQYAAQTFLNSSSFIGETVSITDGYHSPAILNSTPTGTEYALAVRQVGNDNANLFDSYGNDLTSVGGALKVSGHSLTNSTSSSVIVSNTAILIIASNPQRKSLIISNNGSTNIYLGATNTIASSGANMGIKILPNGTYMDSGIDTYTGDIYGVSDSVSASYNVAVWERT